MMQLNLKKTLLSAALVLTAPFFALAQNITVSGTITDQSGETIIGAAVMVLNTTVGAVTGVDGTYSLQVSPSATLEVSCMGYTTQRIPVQGRSKIDVVTTLILTHMVSLMKLLNIQKMFPMRILYGR